MSQVSSESHGSGGGVVLALLAMLVIAMVVVVAASDEPLLPPETATISGRLTLAGEPMQPGFSVVFMEPQRGDLAFGTTDANGRFTVNSSNNGEMPPGTYKVHVMPPAMKGPRIDGLLNADDRGDAVISLPILYPERYRTVETTPLEYKVVPGENRFDIDLERMAEPTPADREAGPERPEVDGDDLVTP